ncbi:Murein DD-endopeptidase MepM and murein hydrolase activator NlpD, contain LysM domain [Paucidesulfovibrio gracilis DSM 16080]|uniref:Murein DD-endopeptidase MepM and murein hydrolase activator NlpD, contain LysM domain n=1 Tax=Paucidesulfovibrio gracilis DSM 16080 TaxID=1121449 RepID=A0A1T4W4F5_9BACT|nr:Murein DD-endopeptidase MepM and murein hydrolase activator NlpD, contain LysM domain [Paucidesulfovibrio gracilis DSM 16080]
MAGIKHGCFVLLRGRGGNTTPFPSALSHEVAESRAVEYDSVSPYGDHKEKYTVRFWNLTLLAVMLFSSLLLTPGASLGQEAAPASSAQEAVADQSENQQVSEGEEIFVLAHPAAVSLGQPFVARLTSSRPLEDVRVSWMDKDVRPSVGDWNGKYVALALLGTDVLYNKPGVHYLRVSALVDGELRTFNHPVAVQKKQYPEQRLTLEQKMVTAPPKQSERVARDRKAVRAALSTISPERKWTLPLLRPVSGKVTSLYGYRRILNGQPKNPHRGLDMRAAVGTPVKACEKGVVILSDDHYYAGNSVYVDHGNGVISMYFHLSERKVEAGQSVERGDVIGLAGATGRATGPHLHFGVAVQGRMVDPQTLVTSDVDDLLRPDVE